MNILSCRYEANDKSSYNALASYVTLIDATSTLFPQSNVIVVSTDIEKLFKEIGSFIDREALNFQISQVDYQNKEQLDIVQDPTSDVFALREAIDKMAASVIEANDSMEATLKEVKESMNDKLIQLNETKRSLEEYRNLFTTAFDECSSLKGMLKGLGIMIRNTPTIGKVKQQLEALASYIETSC